MAARRSKRATAPATVTVRSPLYPELLVLTPRVEFHDGAAEVTVDVVEELRALPEEFGLLLDGEDPSGEDVPTPEDGEKPEESEESEEPDPEDEDKKEETW